VSQSSPYTFAASDVQSTLRNAGHLVYADSLRHGIWCFHLVGKDGSSIGLTASNGLGITLEVCGYKLGLVEDGGFDPVFLLKGRNSGAASINTPSGTSPSGSAIDMTLRNAQPFAMASSQALDVATDVDTKGSSVAESKGYTSIPVKDVYEYFITAVLSSLSSFFCSKTGAIALNYRSVLLPAEFLQGSDGFPVQRFTKATLATFRVYLTTTGSLIISLCHSVVRGLAPSAEALSSGLQSVGAPLLAAPLGVYATYQGILDAEHPSMDPGAVQSPDTQTLRLRSDREDRLALWKADCAKMLETRGISPNILQGSIWLSIQYSRRRASERVEGKRMAPSSTTAHVLWPSALCFWKLGGGAPGLAHRSKSSYNAIGGLDALSDAQTWFQGAEERDAVIAKRIQDRDATTTRDIAEGDGRNVQPNGYSPLALRNSGNNGLPGSAAAGTTMYPTPPDGVQATVGVTSSFDGVVSSPANQGTTTALVDVDTTMANASNNEDPFGEDWDGGDVKRGPENLFDDMGDDYFTNNDITDADFSFFDEQPDGDDLDFSGVADLGPTPDVALEVERAAMAPQTAIAPPGPSMDPEMAPPVFAKPELKHARSSLGDDSRQTAAERKTGKPLAPHGIKRPASPFNQDTVYKRVKASLGPHAVSVSSVTKREGRRRGSIFERVDFSPLLSLSSKKYAENGRFNCDWETSQEPATEGATSSAAGSSKQSGRGNRAGFKKPPENMGALIASITGGLEVSSLQGEANGVDDSPSDASDVSETSDEDALSASADEALSPTKSAITRKRLDDDSVSLAASLKESEGATVPPPQISTELLRFPSSDISEASVARFFADPEPSPPRFVLTDDDFMTVAQVLTEQAVGGSLKLPANVEEAGCIRQSFDNRRLADQTRRSVETLRSVLPATLSGAASYQFRPFLELQDLPLLGPPTRLQPRVPGGTEPVRVNVFPIPIPHFELRRNDAKLSMAATAVNFWEILGLGPSGGHKDINAVCVYPNREGMSDDVNIFLERTKILYESLKLGTHDRLGSADGIMEGLVPIDLDKTVTTPLSSVLSRHAPPGTEQIGRLAQALAAQSVAERNFVIYFLYSPASPTAVLDACVSFYRLFELYKKALSARSPISNELVLQLVPLDFVTSASTLVLPPSSEYASLCLETYDRCTLFSGPMPSPAILLEQPLPRGIDFKFTTTPSENLFHENSCIHIAYAQSIDERWVTAAWTDNRGGKQMTASYCLGRKGKPLSTPVAVVAREIWETTHDLISMWKVHWRVVITKCGTMEQDEIDLWLDLAKNESKVSVTLMLLTVDTNPSLQLVPPALKAPASAPNMFYTTPVSTPQPSIVSPEQSGNNPPTPLGAGSSANATTPGGDNAATEPDSDATLIDVTETSWGTVVSHRLNNSSVLGDLNPALASGYLVKRTGPRPEDPPALMEVNVIHTGANVRAYEPLLREMLMYFRQLGTLARARGMVDRVADVRPWHVAAAEKGVRALYMLM